MAKTNALYLYILIAYPWSDTIAVSNPKAMRLSSQTFLGTVFIALCDCIRNAACIIFAIIYRFCEDEMKVIIYLSSLGMISIIDKINFSTYKKAVYPNQKKKEKKGRKNKKNTHLTQQGKEKACNLSRSC